MTTTTRINEVMAELKEYMELEESLKAEIERLQDEIKDYMIEENLDEVVSDTGLKATFREVISKRFDSTKFKKEFAELYLRYVRQTTYKRFTLN